MNYRGFEISLDDKNGELVAKNGAGEVVACGEGIDYLKHTIDHVIQTNFRRQNVLVLSDTLGFATGTATSLTDYGQSVYVTMNDDRKSRAKLRASKVYKDTPENRQHAEMIESHVARIRELVARLEVL